MHGFVRRFGAFDRPVANTSRDFLGAFQCNGKTLAGFRDFFPGHISGGGHQSARVFSDRAHVIANFLCIFIHNFLLFLLI